MFNAHTAVELVTSGTGFRFGRIPIQAVRPKTNKSPAHMKKEYWKPAVRTRIFPRITLLYMDPQSPQ
ncbi:hypothetical protein [Bacillus sp. SD075]|uniref:hypothetical protein n=1 Tax=Bacillus sp. SD075 TaxID=2781732 RepID=UPI001A97BB35|nr:hypothetical protein [Bacillus sp. SD075]